VLLGDSITANNGQTTATQESDAGFWNHAMVYMGQRIPVIANAGIGGQGCATMLARLSTDVLALRPQYAMVMCGTNDIATQSAASIIAAKTSIYDQIRAIGTRLIISATPPDAAWTDPTSIAKYQAVYAADNAYAAAHLDVIYAPMAEAIWTSLNNPVPLANTTADGVHPSRYGAALMGKAAAAAIVAALDTPPVAALVTKNTFDGNMLTNGLMTGTGGTLATCTGTVADSWTLTCSGGAAAVGSKVARTDGLPGEWQQIAVTGTTPPQGAAIVRLSQTTGITDFKSGETVQLYVEWQSDNNWTAMERFNAYVNFVGGDDSTLRTLNPEPADTTYQYNGSSGVWHSKPWLITGNATVINTYIEIQGQAGTVRIGRVQIRRVGVLGTTRLEQGGFPLSKTQMALNNVENTKLSTWTGSDAIRWLWKCTLSNSPVTIACYDDTATSGATTFTLRAGAGQASTRLFQLKNSAGTEVLGIGAAGTVEGPGYYGNADKFYLTGSNLLMASDFVAKFSSTTSQGGGVDVGFGRAAAGVLKITNGSSGLGKLAVVQATPSTSGDACTAGSIWTDASYIYVCTASGVIKRAALSTF
jgi:lysophospholipase L1-like esterase